MKGQRYGKRYDAVRLGRGTSAGILTAFCFCCDMFLDFFIRSTLIFTFLLATFLEMLFLQVAISLELGRSTP